MIDQLFHQTHIAMQQLVKQKPDTEGQVLLQHHLAQNGQAFDEEDWFYLTWFAVSLSEAKKFSSAERSSMSKFAEAMYSVSLAISKDDVAVSS